MPFVTKGIHCNVNVFSDIEGLSEGEGGLLISCFTSVHDSNIKTTCRSDSSALSG
jgi:hypothetical protein